MTEIAAGRHSLVGTLRLSRDAVAANKPEFAFSILKLPDYGQNSCLYPEKHKYRVTRAGLLYRVANWPMEFAPCDIVQ